MWKFAPLAILSSPASSVSSIRLAALTASARSTPISTSNAPASCAAFTPPGWPALREAFEFHPFFVLPRSPQVNQSGTAPGTHVQGVTFRGLSMSTRTGRPAATSVSSARSGKRFPMILGRLLPFLAPAPLVGGQAVMEGVMMRNGDVYALAVRTADGNISVENRPWFSLTRSELLKNRSCAVSPTLIETLVNGIKALNLSAERSTEGTGEELKDWQLVLPPSSCRFCSPVGLFVVVPHLLSIIMNWIGLGGDVEGFSFHIWDGLFQISDFIGYIVGIAFLPDIRRVFCHHGAEHKTIHAYESVGYGDARVGHPVQPPAPRCGTTFLLFVMSIAILLHTVLVPLLLLVWTPDSAVAKHLLLSPSAAAMVPISALSYELIRYAARLGKTGSGGASSARWACFYSFMTTREPELDQVEVAVPRPSLPPSASTRRALRRPLPATGVIDVCQTRKPRTQIPWIRTGTRRSHRFQRSGSIPQLTKAHSDLKPVVDIFPPVPRIEAEPRRQSGTAQRRRSRYPRNGPRRNQVHRGEAPRA